MAKIIDSGNWKITEAEYQKARELAARCDGEVSQCAWQLQRYCMGKTFNRDDAVKSLQAIRGWI